jgi:hypothetical protein
LHLLTGNDLANFLLNIPPHPYDLETLTGGVLNSDSKSSTGIFIPPSPSVTLGFTLDVTGVTHETSLESMGCGILVD